MQRCSTATSGNVSVLKSAAVRCVILIHITHLWNRLDALCSQHATHLRTLSLSRVASALFCRPQQCALEWNQALWVAKSAMFQQDVEAEPFFLTPLAVHDTAQLQLREQGCSGPDPLYTSAVLSLLEGQIKRLNGICFQPHSSSAPILNHVEAALNLGLDSELCTRKAQILWCKSGQQLSKPVMMHSRASDKTLAWLRRCIPRVPQQAIDASVKLSDEQCCIHIETKVLLCVSSCCDPPGRDQFLFD